MLNVKSGLKKVVNWINIGMHLYSKAPTKEIKQNWLIFSIGIYFMLFMAIFSGQYGFKFTFTTEFNNSGGFIFFGFIILFIIFTLIHNKT
jgi:uncharacterized membrane protein